VCRAWEFTIMGRWGKLVPQFRKRDIQESP
jgi:hypothetical protein